MHSRSGCAAAPAAAALAVGARLARLAVTTGESRLHQRAKPAATRCAGLARPGITRTAAAVQPWGTVECVDAILAATFHSPHAPITRPPVVSRLIDLRLIATHAALSPGERISAAGVSSTVGVRGRAPA